jgi:hypothetical protein
MRGLPEPRRTPVSCWSCASRASRSLTVVEFGDRLFLRDGHHRAVTLLAARIKAVPAIMVTGKSYADAATVPGLFGPEVALGDRRSLVTDFLDDRVCAAAIRRPLRKVARICASEFPVPVNSGSVGRRACTPDLALSHRHARLPAARRPAAVGTRWPADHPILPPRPGRE